VVGFKGEFTVGCYRIIDSHYDGLIEEVFIKEGNFVYEWEPLFIIKTPNGKTSKVEHGVSGIVSKVNVKQGDSVFSKMTLAVLEEDTQPTGCD
jgi:biotin carboxyl carrier protein